MDVALWDVKPAWHLDQVSASVAERRGRCVGVRCDLTDPGEVGEALRVTHERLGVVAVLVNAVGLGQHSAFMETSDGDWERIVRVNLLGPVRAMRAVVPDILSGAGGRGPCTRTVRSSFREGGGEMKSLSTCLPGGRTLWAALVCLVLMSFGTTAQGAPPLTKVTVAVATNQFATSVSPYSSVPKFLGYWEEEGLDVNVEGVAGSNVAMPMILTGLLDFAFPGTPSYLATVAQNREVSAYYCMYPHNQFRIAVQESSPITRLADLKGTRIGVPDLASASVIYARSALRSIGLNDEKDVEFLPLGNQAVSVANGLLRNQVQAFVGFDNNIGGLEALSIRMRVIKSDFDAKLGCGMVISAKRSRVENQRRIAVGIARGIARATLFALTNPVAAVQIHWKVYPETKPTAIAESEALQRGVMELKARLETMRVDDTPRKLWGYVPEDTFQFYQQFLYSYQQIKQILPFKEAFNDSLIADINRWDQTAIVRQAREYKGP